MKKNKFSIIGIVIGVVNFIASLFYIPTLPDTVPTHFDASFRVDAVGSSKTAYLMAALPLAVALGILLELLLRKKDYENRRVLQITLVTLTLFFTAMNWLTLLMMGSGAQMGEIPEITGSLPYMLLILMGLVFVLMGNYLPTVQQNRTLGIKISWTLNNVQCWKLTHRFGGKVFVAGGLLLILGGILCMVMHAPYFMTVVLMMAVLTAAILVIGIYAYQHRND